MAIQKPLPIEKMAFRKTNSHLGRSLCVTPSNSTNRHLSYARIRLVPSVPSLSFETDLHPG